MAHGTTPKFQKVGFEMGSKDFDEVLGGIDGILMPRGRSEVVLWRLRPVGKVRPKPCTTPSGEGWICPQPPYQRLSISKNARLHQFLACDISILSRRGFRAVALRVQDSTVIFSANLFPQIPMAIHLVQALLCKCALSLLKRCQ